MARGPLPQHERRRTNAPTIPTTSLPASGRKGRAPKPPYPLDVAGTNWWAWAWKLPQACAWSAGDLYVICRRAQLEDIVIGLTPQKGLAAVQREMRELDDRLGLTPKAMAALRWKIVDDADQLTGPVGVDSADGRRDRLTVAS